MESKWPIKRLNEIDTSRSAIIDASSLVDFFSFGFFGGFSESVEKFGNPPNTTFERYVRSIVSEALSRKRFDGDRYGNDQRIFVMALSFLEQCLLYDKIYVDKSSLDSLKRRANPYHDIDEHYRAFDGLLELISVNLETYETIGSNLVQLKERLEALNQVSIFNNRKITNFEVEPYSHCDLKDGVMAYSAWELRHSNNSVLRALFYHELSNTSGLSLILHPKKAESIPFLMRELTNDYHAIYQSLSGKVLESLDLKESELVIPPFADMILAKAFKEGLSLIDATLELRGDSEVTECRQMFQNLEVVKQSAGRIKYNNEIQKLADEIANRLRQKDGNEILSRKRINLNSVPSIGAILDLFGTHHLDIPDFTLWEKPYVTLYNRWVNFGG